MLFVLKQMYSLEVESALIQLSSQRYQRSDRSWSLGELLKTQSYSNDGAWCPRSKRGWEKMIIGETALPEATAGWGWVTGDVHGRQFLFRGLGL